MKKQPIYMLYYAPGTASMAVHWMLIELGVPFELRLVDLKTKAQKNPEYLRLNPNGMVPTLVVDGVPHAEAAALVTLLAERHPEAGLEIACGTPERADYLQWMFYFANTVQPLFRMWYYTDEVAGEDLVETVKQHTRPRIETAWDRVAARLRDVPYVAGEKRSAADFLAMMLMSWSWSMPKPADRWPAIADYFERMTALPSYATLIEREGLPRWTRSKV